jgi:hypothetical protein
MSHIYVSGINIPLLRLADFFLLNVMSLYLSTGADGYIEYDIDSYN